MYTIKTVSNKKPRKGIYTIEANLPTEGRASIIRFLFDKDKKNSRKRIAFDPEFYTSIKHTEKPDIYDIFGFELTTHPEMFIRKLHYMTQELNEINQKCNEFLTNHPTFSKSKMTHYTKYLIPKERPGEFREIVAPVGDLKKLQREMYDVIQKTLRIKTHDAAFGYVIGRDNVKNAERHRYGNYITKLDLKNCFPSITKTFIKAQLLKLEEFAIINIPVARITGEEYDLQIGDFITNNIVIGMPKELITYKISLKTFLDNILLIATLKNELPQGSPLSPHILNLVLVEVDELIKRKVCNNKNIASKLIMYTRYSDDLTFSSTTHINTTELVKVIEEVFTRISAPLTINADKIREIRPRNRCYVTGVKINREHNTTFGHEKKDILKKDLFAVLMSYARGETDHAEARTVFGRLSYLHKIEPAYAKNLIRKYAEKFQIPTIEIYKRLT
jgi:RNA-directed DNA polymerase